MNGKRLIMTTDILSSETARQRVEEFRNRHGETRLDFACHAALPVALNCELVHFLRVHFFTDSPDSLHWTTEADLVFSSIMKEIDADLYEIPREIRDILLKRLSEKYGHRRIRQIASLLWQYTRHKMPWQERTGLERAQELTALHCLDPEKAEQWLEEAENLPRQRGTGDREWFVAMRDELGRRAVAMAVGEEDKPARRKYWLRDEPMMVSDEEAEKVFSIRKVRIEGQGFDTLRPVEYIENDYEDNGDGTVTDHATGLMWEKSGSDKFLSFEEAKEYVSRLNLAGYRDWRLPTLEELMSLLEPEKQENGRYINPVFDEKQWWCWSSDRRLSGGAWGVYFYFGSVDWDDFNYYVRCVRA